MKKIPVIGVILLLIIFSFSSINYSKEMDFLSSGNILYVGGGGTGNYSTIQSAIDDTQEGDMVFVYNGVYNEQLFIDRSIDLIGEDKNFTIIDGSTLEENIVLMKINCSNVKFSGFTMKDAKGIDGRAFEASNKNSFIRITENIVMTGNIFRNFDNGGFIMNPKNCIVTDNLMYNCGIGAYFTHRLIFDNDFSNNFINDKPKLDYFNKNNFFIDAEETGGIFLHNCKNVLIKNIKMSNVTVGISMSFCSRIYVTNVTVINTGRGGIYAFNCRFCRFVENTFEDDNWGIFIRESNFNLIRNNNFINISQPDWFASSYFNNWNRNYWGEPYSPIKKIFGNIEFTLGLKIPWYNFDWNPLKEPFGFNT
jgi:parallel beta-helix repeat protein